MINLIGCVKNKKNLMHPNYHNSKVEEVIQKEEVKQVSVMERVELMEWSECNSRQGECVSASVSTSKKKDKTNSLLSLKHPKNFKVKTVRRPKIKLPKKSESQIQSNINFWEN